VSVIRCMDGDDKEEWSGHHKLILKDKGNDNIQSPDISPDSLQTVCRQSPERASRQSPDSLQTISKQSPDSTQTVSVQSPGSLQTISRQSPHTISTVSRPSPGNFQIIFRPLPNNSFEVWRAAWVHMIVSTCNSNNIINSNIHTNIKMTWP